MLSHQSLDLILGQHFSVLILGNGERQKQQNCPEYESRPGVKGGSNPLG